MSTQNPNLKPLEPGDLMESPLQTMWKWHLINALTFQAADTLERSFVHKRIAEVILDKSHVAEKTNKNGIFAGVRRHRHNTDLLIYGDLLKVKEQHENEETKDTPEK